jgi:hypothetical protein
MKNFILIFLIVFTTACSAQNPDKIKGSKIVTIEQKEIESFTALEVEEDFEVMLIKGSKPAVEIEADDNLHEVISATVVGGILYIRKTKKIVSAKKVGIRVTFTDDLKIINSRYKSKITALATIELAELQINGFENSELFLNVKAPIFSLNANDKTKVELNLKSDKTKIVLDKNAEIKALINSKNIDFDLYQKSEATIEGDCEQLNLRIDNNAKFVGQNLVAKKVEIIAEMSSKIAVQQVESANVESSGKAEIYFYGAGKINLTKFADESSIYKKSL